MKLRTFFASWLAYFVGVAGLFWYASLTGFLNQVLHQDKSHLVGIMLVFYALVEMVIGFRFWRTSQDLSQIGRIQKLLQSGDLTDAVADKNRVILGTGETYSAFSTRFSPGAHFANLIKKARPGQELDQTILLESFAQNISSKNNLPKFAIDAFLVTGVIGTIYGLYLTVVGFQGVALEKIVANLPEAFAGIGVALLPSLVAAVLSLFLHFNRWNLNRGSTSLKTNVANVSETHLVPFLETRAHELG